jgi:DNA-binding GntR family transcriptional regulator
VGELRVATEYLDVPEYRTAQAIVAARLRRGILSGQLAPGTRLLQVEVAQAMRVSTTPVREAMRELASEGLVDLDAHRGVEVHRGSRDEFIEIYQVRMLLEPFVSGATARLVDPATLGTADSILDRMEREPDVAEWTLLNSEFHSLLSRASGLPTTNAILTRLRNISALYIAQCLASRPDRLHAAESEHRAILRTLQDGDAAAAKEAEVAHLRRTYEIVVGQHRETDISTALPA